jgi:hypothetical protein
VPLVKRIDELLKEYREFVVNGTQPVDKPVLGYDDAVACAKEILKQKKSAKVSLEKLLQVLYGCETNLKD